MTHYDYEDDEDFDSDPEEDYSDEDFSGDELEDSGTKRPYLPGRESPPLKRHKPSEQYRNKLITNRWHDVLAAQNQNSNSSRSSKGAKNAVALEDKTAKTKARTEANPANPGQLHLYFVAMGQGDCAIVITPDKDVFIIDIGTKGGSEKNNAGEDVTEDTLRTLLRQPHIVGQDSRVQGLILTHCDADHNNKISALYEESVGIERTYHPDVLAAYNARSSFKNNSYGAVNQVMEQLQKTGTGSINTVSYTTSLTEATQTDTWKLPSYSVNTNDPCNNTSPYKGYQQQPYPSYTAIKGNSAIGLNIPALPYASLCDKTGIETPIPYGPQAPVAGNFTPYHETGQGFIIYDKNGCSIRLLVANYRDAQDCYIIANPGGDRPNQTTYCENYNTNCTKNATQQRGEIRTIWEPGTTRYSEARDINQASIITHIRYERAGTVENYVICGDATEKTLQMVLREYDIKDVTLLQAPHHGSITNGSDLNAFFTRMKPKIALYSSPYLKDKPGHAHPKLSNIEGMKTAMGQNLAYKSSYGGWQGDTYAQQINMPYRIYVTGWMENYYYHYQSPVTYAGNHPGFRKNVDPRPAEINESGNIVKAPVTLYDNDKVSSPPVVESGGGLMVDG